VYGDYELDVTGKCPLLHNEIYEHVQNISRKIFQFLMLKKACFDVNPYFRITAHKSSFLKKFVCILLHRNNFKKLLYMKYFGMLPYTTYISFSEKQ